MSELHDLTGANRTLDDIIEAMQDDLRAKGGDMPVDSTAYIDAKTDAVRAQNDARFSEVLFELRLMRETAVTRRAMWAATGTGVAAVLGTLLAVLAFAGDRFDAGIGLSGQKAEQAEVDARQDDRFNVVIDKLDTASQRINDVAVRVEGIEKRLIQPVQE